MNGKPNYLPEKLPQGGRATGAYLLGTLLQSYVAFRVYEVSQKKDETFRFTDFLAEISAGTAFAYAVAMDESDDAQSAMRSARHSILDVEAGPDLVPEFDDGDTAARRDQESLAFIVGLSEGFAKSPMLDWGAGHGDDVKFAQDRGLEAFAYDPKWHPKKPSQRSYYEYGQLSFVLDIVQGFHGRVDVLREFGSYLAPGAAVVITVITPQRLQQHVREARKEGAVVIKAEGGVRINNVFFGVVMPAEMAMLMGESGFTYEADIVYQDDDGVPVALVYLGKKV